MNYSKRQLLPGQHPGIEKIQLTSNLTVDPLRLHAADSYAALHCPAAVVQWIDTHSQGLTRSKHLMQKPILSSFPILSGPFPVDVSGLVGDVVEPSVIKRNVGYLYNQVYSITVPDRCVLQNWN